jgi:branched-chain amino acid transport system permease protein
MRFSRRGLILAVVFGLLFGFVPLIGLHVPWILPGTIDVVNSTGTLEVLALCFIFAGVSLGYDVMFGFTGLLSLGPVMYFAVGVYVFGVALTAWNWPLVPALALTFGVSLVLAVVLGAIALRVSGIAFAMVTLAFAQAFYFLIEDNPHGLTGGDTGLAVSTLRLPSFMSGAVSNTRNLYWIAFGFLVVAYAVVWLVTESATGRVFVAIRENERRLEVLGIAPFRYKLVSFTLSSLIATAGGVVYLLLIGTAVPSAVASTTVTLSILIMVVLGGAGTRWGAVSGAIIYVYLQQFLLKVAAQPSFATLPAFLRVPLSQPQFLLGAIFVLFVIFVPGGLAGLVGRATGRATRHALAKGLSLPQAQEPEDRAVFADDAG